MVQVDKCFVLFFASNPFFHPTPLRNLINWTQEVIPQNDLLLSFPNQHPQEGKMSSFLGWVLLLICLLSQQTNASSPANPPYRVLTCDELWPTDVAKWRIEEKFAFSARFHTDILTINIISLKGKTFLISLSS